MTNAEIIARECEDLMKNGVLQVAGNLAVTIPGSDEEIEIPYPEEIHTLQGWKVRGYAVKKGEKAVAKFAIWIPYEVEIQEDEKQEKKKTKKTKKSAKEETAKKTTKFKYRISSFFKLDQVEKLEKKTAKKKAKKPGKPKKTKQAKKFYYGMKHRPFDIGCQPEDGLQGLVENQPPEIAAKYYSVIEYDRKLTETEISDFELEYITEA